MKGPQRQFDMIHILRTLLIIEREKKIGRKDLVKQLDIGEGSVRSVLKFLVGKNLVTSAVAKGHSLTKKGIGFVTKLHSIVIGPKNIDAKDLTIGIKDAAILVKNAAIKVKLGINERDAAIKAGSLGATVLVVKNNNLTFPGQSEEKINNKELESSFNYSNGDVLIIGTDNSFEKAENAAIAVLLELIENEIKFE